MSNQIRLKRASGSDPSASDLVLGEPAVRTDTGEIFLKKDDGTIQKVAGTDDGDKGDITVSNSGATFTIDNDAVTYAKIQNVSATNRILGRDSSGAGVIEEITPANLRTMINVEDGSTADQSASEILTLLKTVDGAGSGLDADTLDGVQGSSFLQNIVSDSSPQLGADLDTNSFEILFDDDHAIKFGASNDLQIKHNSSGSSSIANTGSGALTIQNANSEVNMFNTTDNEYLAQFINGGASKLYHDGTRRLETSSYGSVTTGVHSITNGILETKAAIATSHTLTADYNALAVSPTINNGVTVTVPSGAVWAIV